jgi:Ca2+-binding RTX toxin-like protein
LKADAFATADCKFQLANLAGTAAGFTASGATVANDPTTGCDENALLLRKPDGTIQYKQTNSIDPPGINGQAVYNGTAGVDRVAGGLDSDTFWGAAGNDVIEGGSGDDVALGGDGNDIMTDLDGADVTKGGPGNDAIDGGPGTDISMGGDGQDVMNGGSLDNETFAGPGNDFIIAGLGADVVFGDGGDDWIEGGSGQDLLQGDHAAPFFDDPAESKPGNDLFIGQVGENDYDAEGGDDVMSQNVAVDRNAGGAGFDWAFHQYDNAAANDDMNINANLAGLPLPVVVNRDRWQETEAVSGGALDDVIKGDDFTPSLQGGAGGIVGGFTGCDALDQAGLDRIPGLSAIVTLRGNAQTDVGHVPGLVCPLSGPFWGAGNILLGGAGSDTLEGRGANDVLDGDRAMSVRISVRTNPANPGSEIGSTDLMEHQYLKDAAGNLTGPTLQAAVFAGTVNPGNLVAVREITTPANATAAGVVDTAKFFGPRSSYTITTPPGLNRTRMIVTQTGPLAPNQKVSDGSDTLFNIEKLQFSDITVSVLPLAARSPTLLTFTSRAINTGPSAAQTVTLTNNGAQPLVLSRLSISIGDTTQFRRSATPGTCTATTTLAALGTAGNTCTYNVVFQPTTAGAKLAFLQFGDNSDGIDSNQYVRLMGTGT